MEWEWGAWFVGYLLALVMLHRRAGAQNQFWSFPQQKRAWWLAASLASSSFSISNAGLISSALSHYGPDGVFFVWSGIVGMGVFPLVFAPLWARLDFISENEFILLRFRGRWSHRLFRFRSLLLTGIVVPILLAFILVATRDLLVIFVGWTPQHALFCMGLVMGLIGWRSSLLVKSRVDMLNFFLMVAVAGVAVFNLFSGQIPFRAFTPVPASLSQMLPFEFAVFMGLQWWSSELLDGSGIHAQSLMGQGNLRIARNGALGGQILVVLMGAAVALVAMHAQTALGADGDDAYLLGFRNLVPAALQPLLAIALLGIALSTASSFMNWGSGMFVALVRRAFKEFNPRRLGSLATLYLATSSALIAAQLDSLLQGIQLVLVITAGVGPVFVLRWFWWRITAQVQLAAMLGAYAVVPVVQSALAAFPIRAELSFAATLTFSSLGNTLWWLVVAFASNKSSDRAQFESFRSAVQPTVSVQVVLRLVCIGMGAFVGILLLRQILIAL